MKPSAIVVGAGPAGLSAAEVLSQAGWAVTIVEALASPGRKFLRAGVGGLNLTHSQPFEAFLEAYGPHRPRLEPFLRRFGPKQLQVWAENLGIALFRGTSGRIFPRDMGASGLLDAWLARLAGQGAILKTGTRWMGWGQENQWKFEDSTGEFSLGAEAGVLALGGPTWPVLGTGGAWCPLLEARGTRLAPWRPANVGFTVDWSAHFRERFAGHPLKETVLEFDDQGAVWRRKGELMVTPWGLEGGLLYAAGARLRDSLLAGHATKVTLDLVPGRSPDRVETDLSRPRNGRSLATHLHRVLGLTGVKVGLLREVLPPGSPDDPARVASLLKALPVTLTGVRPLEEAISAAGGVCWDELTPDLGLRRIPYTWCAGEMIDWEAPTGGYLLTACFSLGRAAGQAVIDSRSASRPPVGS
jgi:uncharacterized flavoprotein (TIGR03862 family)